MYTVMSMFYSATGYTREQACMQSFKDRVIMSQRPSIIHSRDKTYYMLTRPGCNKTHVTIGG